MKKKIIILAAILGILLAVVLLLKQGETRERSFNVFSADSSQIAKIRILSPSDTLELIATDSGWKLTEPVQWDANSEQMKMFFRDVIGATSSKTIMTDDQDAVQRYGLVPGEALQVIVWDKKNKQTDHVYFNNFGQTFDYFRYEGSNEIYQLRTLISRTYDVTLQYWRSPAVLRVFEDVLSSIEVSYSAGSYRLSHENGKWIYRDASNAFEIHVENRPLLRALNILNNLDTMVFYDGDNSQYLEAFRNPECTVVLNMTDGSRRKLAFAPINENEYALMMDDKPDPLFGIAKDSMLRFTLHKDYFRQLPYGSTPPPSVQ